MRMDELRDVADDAFVAAVEQLLPESWLLLAWGTDDG